MDERNLYNELFKIAADEEFKWTMFRWYMQGMHQFNFWTLDERR